ncbi:MAG: aminotransferase class IV [Bacteroidales bacterium]|nr:aminotransferase class IV [Bacteroidales bacterium]MCF8390992.1 aminotransferase class IV [Bacteroidales bacterium]
MKEITGSYYYLDDEILSSDEFDFQFLSSGVNVYEVLRFINAVPIFFEEHFKRLLNSAEGNKLCHSVNKQFLLKNILELLKHNSATRGNIKIVLHAEKNSNCELYIYQTPHFYPSDEDYAHGVKIVSLNEGRPDPNLKTWRPHFKETVYNLKKALNAYEILLVDKGFVREGSQSNFFAIYQNKVMTAPANAVLRGVTREIVFQICREENINIEEADFSMADLLRAQAAFLTGTSPGILPISLVDDHPFPPAHPILKILLEKYNEIIQKHINKLQ